MRKQYLFLLAAGLLMAGCSKDSVEYAPESDYDLIPGQPAFFSVDLRLPLDNSGGTRAGNDDFDDGVAAEYAVYSGHLVLFKGANESSAKLLKAYAIDKDSITWNSDGSGAPQISQTTTNYVQEIDAPSIQTGEKLFAYVILNDTGNNTGIDFSSGQTFSDFSTQVLQAIGIANESNGYGAMGSNGLVMTSVAAATNGGGDAAPASGTTVTALAPVDPEKIHDTYKDAKTGDAATCIIVERAAVKIQVKFGTGITDPAKSTGTVVLNGWALGNTNYGTSTGTGYYNVRQVSTDWFGYKNNQVGTTNFPLGSTNNLYRFISKDSMEPSSSINSGSSHQDIYRTYFGKDVNYKYTSTSATSGLIHTEVEDSEHTFDSGDYVYTYENTFDENNQYFKFTTYVSFKTTLNGGDDFWTIATAGNTALDETTLKTKLGNNIGAAKTTEINALITAIEDAISTDIALGASSSTIIDADTHEATPLGITTSTVITFELEHDVTLGTLSTDKIQSYSDKLKFKSIKVGTDEVGAGVKTAINNLLIGTDKISDKLAGIFGTYAPDVVTKYEGGVAYYTARIAHFGDYETPWSAPNDAHDDYAKIYPSTGQSLHQPIATKSINFGASRAAAWLGRWGIVRNNWYVITVTGVTGIGDALPQDYSGDATPDDNPTPKYYISAHIHLAPWVMRGHSVVLE